MAASALLAAANAEAAASFSPAPGSPITADGPKPQGIAIADFNGDGKNDLAITNYGSITTDSTVSIFLGDGAGNFTDASGSPISLTGQKGAYTVVADDFDGDGKKDIAVANLGTDTISVLRGNGNGTFVAPVTLAMTGGAVAPATPIKEPISIGVGNFNGDAKRDLVVADFGSGVGTQDVQVFLNTSSGTGNIAFGAGTSIATGNEAAFVAVGNFDSANGDDFVVSNLSDNTVTVYLNNGSGSFPSGTVRSMSDGVTDAKNPAGIAVADLNADGHPDLIIGCFGSTDQDLTARVAVLLGSSSGTFGALTLFARGDNGPQTVSTADFDADGKLDVVVANNQSNTVSVYAGTGTGSLTTPPINFTVGTAPFLVVAGLVDTDGKPDIVATNATSNDISALLNTTTFTADLQVVSVSDGLTAAVPGNADNYTVTIKNNGPALLSSLTMTLTLPSQITFTTFTPSSGSYNSGTGAWTGLTFASGQTATLIVGGTIGAAATGTMTFTAAIATPGGITDPTPGNNSATDNNTVLTPQANLGITKTDGVTRTAPNQGLTYTITASNAGPSNVTNATVADTFPATLTGATWTCLGASGGSCTTANGSGNINNTVTLPVGGTATFSANVTVAANATTSVVNMATVTVPGGTTDPTPGNNSATDTDTQDQAPTATAKSVSVGHDNSGVVITLTGTDPESDTLTFAIVTGPTNGTFTVPLNTNSGQVTYKPTAGYVGGDSFTFRVTDSFGVVSAAAATVTITVTDQAPTADAQSVSLNANDTLPIVLTGSDPESDPFTFGIVSGPSHGTLSPLPPPSNGHVTYTPTTDYSGPDSFTFKVSETSPSAQDSAPATVSITVTPVADLAITKTDGATRVVPGGSVTYTIEVTNAGPQTAAGATVTDTFPASLTGVTWTCAVTGGASCPASGAGNINGVAVTVPVGGKATFTAHATVSNGATGSIANTASVATPLGTTDPASGNNSATDTDDVDQAPTATPQNGLVSAGPSLVITLAGTDPESDPLTFAKVTNPSHGTLSAVSGNKVTYTPNAGFHNQDSFTFKATDSFGRDSAPATVTIQVVPALADVHFGATSYVVTEGSIATITVKREGSTTAPLDVDYTISDGTGHGGTDYDASSSTTTGLLTFTAGAATRTFTVKTLPNTLADGDRTVLLSLSETGGTEYVGGLATSVLTIKDNDVAGKIQFGAVAYTVNEANTTAIIKVTRTGGIASGATVDFSATGGTATPGVDYTQVLAQPVVFAAGQTSQNVTVTILDDGTPEKHKTVDLSLGLHTPSGGVVLGTSAAVLTILEDNPVIQFSAANFSASESSSKATITVKRSGPTADVVTVHYATANGTAVAGTDYTATSGDLTFIKGLTVKSFTVPLLNDAAHEPNRVVNLALSAAADTTNPGQAALGQQSTAILTINDTDQTPTVQLGASAYNVGQNAGTVNVLAKRIGATASTVKVHYATSDGSGHFGTDYTTKSGDLTFTPGVVSLPIPITILPVPGATSNETFNVTLSSPQATDNPQAQAALGTPSAAVVTIVTDDPLVQYSAATYKVGEVGPKATITVKRSGPMTGTVHAAYATTPGTAIAGTDYTTTSGSLTFGPNVSTQTFDVPVTDSGLVQKDKTVNLSLSSVDAGVGPSGSAVLTLTSDDPSVAFTKDGFVVAESGKTATITLKRTGNKNVAFTVPFSTSDGSAHAGVNYTSVNTPIVFATGAISRSVIVPILNDTVDEVPPLTLSLTLGTPNFAVLGTPSTAALVITDNDVAGSIQLAAADYSVGEAGFTAVVTVTRTGGSASAATAHWATSDGTATSIGPNRNYTASSGTVTFDAGQTSAVFTVDVRDDGIATGSKTVHLTLSSPGGGATLGPRTTATLWIVNAE